MQTGRLFLKNGPPKVGGVRGKKRKPRKKPPKNPSGGAPIPWGNPPNPSRAGGPKTFHRGRGQGQGFWDPGGKGPTAPRTPKLPHREKRGPRGGPRGGAQTQGGLGGAPGPKFWGWVPPAGLALPIGGAGVPTGINPGHPGQGEPAKRGFLATNPTPPLSRPGLLGKKAP
ncbi:MAG: hypothetical protein CM15mP39_05220 [Synechococcus sp.]|nr:MAG: hypothetical protein CM15mP39_05220 [Synechococcus sp.]